MAWAVSLRYPIDPVTTDPKGEAHSPPVRKTPALTLLPEAEEGGNYGGVLQGGGSVDLHPWYVTGLVEGEGTFTVSFNRRPKLRVGVETRPAFSVSLSERDLDLLKALQDFFGCGAIRYSRSDRTYKYEVRSAADLARKIIPHFEKYPLAGAKGKDFQKFAQIVRWVHANHHLNPDYLREIIEMAYSMNPSGQRRYAKDDLLRLLGEMKG